MELAFQYALGTINATADDCQIIEDIRTEPEGFQAPQSDENRISSRQFIHDHFRKMTEAARIQRKYPVKQIARPGIRIVQKPGSDCKIRAPAQKDPSCLVELVPNFQHEKGQYDNIPFTRGFQLGKYTGNSYTENTFGVTVGFQDTVVDSTAYSGPESSNFCGDLVSGGEDLYSGIQQVQSSPEDFEDPISGPQVSDLISLAPLPTLPEAAIGQNTQQLTCTVIPSNNIEVISQPKTKVHKKRSPKKRSREREYEVDDSNDLGMELFGLGPSTKKYKRTDEWQGFQNFMEHVFQEPVSDDVMDDLFEWVF